MWKRTLWRRVDLMEKQNKPFFAINRELSKIIIEAVQRGVLIPYSSDSVKDTNIMNREDFLTNIQQETFEEEDPFGGSDFVDDDPFAAFGEPILLLMRRKYRRQAIFIRTRIFNFEIGISLIVFV